MDRLWWLANRLSEAARRGVTVLRCMWLERTRVTSSFEVAWPSIGTMQRGAILDIEGERLLLLRIKPLGTTARLTVLRP